MTLNNKQFYIVTTGCLYLLALAASMIIIWYQQISVSTISIVSDYSALNTESVVRNYVLDDWANQFCAVSIVQGVVIVMTTIAYCKSTHIDMLGLYVIILTLAMWSLPLSLFTYTAINGYPLYVKPYKEAYFQLKYNDSSAALCSYYYLSPEAALNFTSCSSIYLSNNTTLLNNHVCCLYVEKDQITLDLGVGIALLTMYILIYPLWSICNYAKIKQ
jgi:hypothetical protein